ncbi:MAG: sulfite exporter TauE/SafE family protein [Dehalococcoidia bacterium]|nr:sulfite exporter TauE/SafE family protein [Dehalococcoidia bacterium]
MSVDADNRAFASGATGLTGGFFSGLTGVGGGAIMIPLMTGVLKMRQHTAHGTSLVVIIFAAGASAITYQFSEGVRWPLVGVLLPASLAGAYLGATGVQFIPGMRLRQLFGAFILLVGLRLLLFGEGQPLASVDGLAELAVGAAVGLVGGLISGALGVGGAAIYIPALVLLLGVEQHEAQGVSLCVIVGAAAVGAFTHARHGTLDGRAASWIAPAAVPAGIAGSFLAAELDANVLQRIFAVVAIIVGTQLFATATRALRATPLPQVEADVGAIA